MRTIKNLKELKKAYEDRLASVYEANADPEVIAMHISDLQFAIASIENEIESEQMLMPFRYMLAAFVIFSITLMLYYMV
jgi:hypothetical protein